MTCRCHFTSAVLATILFDILLLGTKSYALIAHLRFPGGLRSGGCAATRMRNNHVFAPVTSSTTSSSATTASAKSANQSPLDQELQSWASSSGFGSIDKSIPAGSSGWASFRKVTVTNPPTSTTDHNQQVSFFVKSSSRSCKEMFEGEALGLKAMHACSNNNLDANTATDSLRIPKVYHYGDYSCGGTGSLLVMEYLNLAGRSDDRSLGRAVAYMHLAPANDDTGNPTKAFGFSVDNTM